MRMNLLEININASITEGKRILIHFWQQNLKDELVKLETYLFTVNSQK